MEFGVAFTSRIGDYDLVALAESLGFDQAWFFEMMPYKVNDESRIPEKLRT